MIRTRTEQQKIQGYVISASGHAKSPPWSADRLLKYKCTSGLSALRGSPLYEK